VSKVIWQKATSLSCHLSQWQMHVCHMCYAGTFASSSRRAMYTALSCKGTLQWAGTCPIKNAPSHWGSGSPSNIRFFELTQVCLQIAFQSIQPILHTDPLCQHTQRYRLIDRRLIGRLTFPLSTKISYIRDKVLGGDLSSTRLRMAHDTVTA